MIGKNLVSLILLFVEMSLFGQMNCSSLFQTKSKDFEYFQISFLDVPSNQKLEVQFFSKYPTSPSNFKVYNFNWAVCRLADVIYIEVPKIELSRTFENFNDPSPAIYLQLYLNKTYHYYKIVETQSKSELTYFLLNIELLEYQADLPIQSFSKKIYYFEKSNPRRYMLMEFNPKTGSKEELLKVKIDPDQSINFLKIRGNHFFYGGFDDTHAAWFDTVKIKNFPFQED
jgi:hypothetical protein